MVNLFKTRQIRDAINAKPEEVQEIINASEYGICITNASGNFAYVNDKYTEIYGYSREELVGQHFLMVVPEESKEHLNDLHEDFIASQREISRSWVVLNKAGKRMRITVDARFSDKLNKQPHKITFVELLEILD
ncbi:PAS domain-containing protein [Eisenibacter elegans]|uniref:PAS domain-containing protein n=1 Tax=Eisenibacter elegans TaxID=997 RepID=UPI0003FCFC4D|nr:PAS sensor domain-containing protein [Eisenibacter elegans]